jgi:hypothetical protein
MIDPRETTFVPAQVAATAEETARTVLHQLEELIHRHPLASAAITLGLGCAIGAAVHELFSPPPPKSAKERALGLLEDIQARLADLMEPVGDMAQNGISAVKSGLHSAAKSKSATHIRELFS